MYVLLPSRSAFSFLDGSTLPEDLISVCAARGMSAMALLDRNGLYGAPRFHLAAQKAGLQAHIGAEVSCESFSLERNCSPQRHRGTETPKKTPTPNDAFEESNHALKLYHSEPTERPASSRQSPSPPTTLPSE